MAKKLSTKEILEAARAEVAGKKQDSDSAEDQAAEEKPAEETPAAAEKETGAAEESPEAPKPAQAAAPSGTPKSTSDILAAARAQAGGGGEKEKPKTETPSKEAPRKEAKPAAGGGAPKSTKDILAAARAQAGGGGAVAAGEKPAASEKPAGKPEAPKAPAGERPSVQEMLKAVRESRPIEAAEEKPTPAKPVLPPRPQKPAPAKAKPKEEKGSRRWFLLAVLASPFAAAWFFFSVTMVGWGLALLRFMMPNILIEPPSKFKIGPPSDYPPGTVTTKWKSQFAVWIVHTEYQGQSMIYALSTVCTHLGCTPNWLEAEQKFKCPCHGSGFYSNGVNFEGPAPRPLERYAIRLAPDGMLEVDKSMKFQEEMGQWGDPASYYVPATA